MDPQPQAPPRERVGAKAQEAVMRGQSPMPPCLTLRARITISTPRSEARFRIAVAGWMGETPGPWSGLARSRAPARGGTRYVGRAEAELAIALQQLHPVSAVDRVADQIIRCIRRAGIDRQDPDTKARPRRSGSGGLMFSRSWYEATTIKVPVVDHGLASTPTCTGGTLAR